MVSSRKFVFGHSLLEIEVLLGSFTDNSTTEQSKREKREAFRKSLPLLVSRIWFAHTGPCLANFASVLKSLSNFEFICHERCRFTGFLSWIYRDRSNKARKHTECISKSNHSQHVFIHRFQSSCLANFAMWFELASFWCSTVLTNIVFRVLTARLIIDVTQFNCSRSFGEFPPVIAAQKRISFRPV